MFSAQVGIFNNELKYEHILASKMLQCSNVEFQKIPGLTPPDPSLRGRKKMLDLAVLKTPHHAWTALLMF